MRSALFWNFTHRRFVVSYRHHSSWTAWPLKMGPLGSPETSVRNYHSTLRKIPKERHLISSEVPTKMLSFSLKRCLSKFWSTRTSSSIRVKTKIHRTGWPVEVLLLFNTQVTFRETPHIQSKSVLVLNQEPWYVTHFVKLMKLIKERNFKKVGNVLDVHSEDVWFKSHPSHWLSWQSFAFSFLSPFSKMLE